MPSAAVAPTEEGHLAAEHTVDVTGGGERVTPDYRNDLFYAHLSLYRFATEMARGRRVLDAGCGTGYGAHWLAERGAADVLGVDVDPTAIAFCRERYGHANLRFAVMDVERLGGLEPESFDLIFTSNTLEHIADVPAFLRAATELLAPDGVLLVAVPAVFNATSRLLQMSNPYHLCIWSPEQWQHEIGRYFREVDARRHILDRTDCQLDATNRPDECRIDASDFAFEELPEDDLRRPTLTSVYVARRPRPDESLPAPGAAPEFIDDSFTRRRPRWVPLDPDQLATDPTPVREVPGRVAATLRAGGLRGVWRMLRSALVWRLRRYLAVRQMAGTSSAGVESGGTD